MNDYKVATQGIKNPSPTDDLLLIIEKNIDEIIGNDECYNHIQALHKHKIELEQLKTAAMDLV